MAIRPFLDVALDQREVVGLARQIVGQRDMGVRTLDAVHKAVEFARASIDQKAVELTVVAVGRLGSRDAYGVKPVLLSPTLKGGGDWLSQLRLLHEVHHAISDYLAETGGVFEGIDSDGASNRRKGLVALYTSEQVAPDSPLHAILHRLAGFNLRCGPGESRTIPDPPHLAKRFGTTSRRSFFVGGTNIDPTMFIEHVKLDHPELDDAHLVKTVFPDDPQNVPTVIYFMLLVIKLSPSSSLSNLPSNLRRQRLALNLLSRIFRAFLFPLITPDASLTAQISEWMLLHHLLVVCYRKDGEDFMPWELYFDLVSLSTSAVFFLAKAQLRGDSEHFLVLHGTALLEKLFGVLRGSSYSDKGLDMVNVSHRAWAAHLLEELLIAHPDWRLLHDRLDIWTPDGFDHSTPRDFVGELRPSSVDLPAAWSRTQDEAHALLSGLFSELGYTEDIRDILRSNGFFAQAPLRQPLVSTWGADLRAVLSAGSSTALALGHEEERDEELDLQRPVSLSHVLARVQALPSVAYVFCSTL